MRTRLLSSLALITLALFGFASSANAAQKPIPSIKSTPEFRQLKGFVSTLFAKRNVRTTNARKGAFKTTLKTRRTKANLKATALYNRRDLRISKQDDKKERRAIKQVRDTQKVRIARLNGSLNDRLGALNAKQNLAVGAINAKYANRIDPLSRKRVILQKRLAKTTNAAKRTRIARKITAVQRQINSFVNARQAAVNAVAARYNVRAANVKDLFAGKFANVRAAAKRQITQARSAYRRLYRQQLAAARQRKSAEVSLITTVRDRGAGYIEQMPVK